MNDRTLFFVTTFGGDNVGDANIDDGDDDGDDDGGDEIIGCDIDENYVDIAVAVEVEVVVILF